MITEISLAQVQLQKCMTNMEKGYFGVAHPDLKTFRQDEIYPIECNKEYHRISF